MLMFCVTGGIHVTSPPFRIAALLPVLLMSLAWTVNGQTVCQRDKITEWRSQTKNITLPWTLSRNICSDFHVECWSFGPDDQRGDAEANRMLNLAQNCPLELQAGDALFISPDRTLERRGMNLANVSRAEFISCSRRGRPASQLLFGGKVRATSQVHPKWLTTGTHLFAEVRDAGALLCTFGLRLNVTVKEHHCGTTDTAAPLCSGHGACLTRPWEAGYICHCEEPYSGDLCQEYNACHWRPCLNGGICSDKNEGAGGRGYRCDCPAQYSGIICSEVIGQCKPNVCRYGYCRNVTPNTFVCECDRDYTGTFCEKLMSHCDPLPCFNDGACRSEMPGYTCDCTDGFSGRNCEINVDECSTEPCLNGATCLDGINGFVCACESGFTGERCERHLGPCNSSPCVNNGSCVQVETKHHCRCLPGFTGKNCQEAIDSCKILSIACLNEGLCLNLINGFSCLCAPGWTGEFCQFVENACLIYPDRCQNKATCIDTSATKEPPQYECRCLTGYTGVHCELEIDECSSNPCQFGGTCREDVGYYNCICPIGFEGRNCEVDVDVCTAINVTCPKGLQCVDQPVGLEYLCLHPCSENPCSETGRCFVSDGTQGYVCVCAPGWAGRRCSFNINECENNWCQNGGTCEDGVNTYRCVCPAGYTGQFCESDIDHCAGNACSKQGTCQDDLHNYTCQCVAGYEGSLCETESNECSSSPCEHGASCIDLIGRFTCRCAAGFTGRTCSVNIDECFSAPCSHGGTCVDLIDGFECICPHGYAGMDCSIDLDLCSKDLCQASTVKCTETMDGHNITCMCQPGFSGFYCERELNECDSDPCLNGGVCEDDLNTYNCFCPDGYEGLNCEINFDDCGYGYCENSSTCLDLVADYACICPAGRTGKNCSADIDECASDPCKNGAACVRAIGGFHCRCAQGFEGYDCSLEVNECLSNPCHPTGTDYCEDLTNKFQCICQLGYMGEICEIPIARCAKGLCHNTLQCEDIPGGFKCHCLPGLTGRFCEVNIDDCQSGACGSLSICQDGLNSYMCYCAPGFVGHHCEIEVNECLSDPCQNGATCSDLLDAFSCLCPDGIGGTSCEININECHSSPCLHHSTCIDHINSYECLCLPGFTGATCETDMDDCASRPCTNGGTCLDRPGSYFCQCPAPFKGLDCELRPCETTSPCENGAACVEETDLRSFPHGFRCLCTRGFTGPRCAINVNDCRPNPCLHGFCYDVVDGFYCLCSPGYAGMRCDQNIDDCVKNSCENNSTCVDLHLSYKCVCPPAWEGDFCERGVNECASRPCKNNAKCTDLIGGYHCTCAAGWRGSECTEDVNECDSNPCLNGATCFEPAIPGTFQCLCPPFFTGALCEHLYDPCNDLYNPCVHDSTCVTLRGGTAHCICKLGFQGAHCEIDTNECISSPCQNHGRCLDEVNGYRCLCMPGFVRIHCEEDINECSSTPCRNNGTCLDLTNRFQCSCTVGFSGAFCELDINECEFLPCLHSGSCINMHGGYQCLCPPGFTGVGCEVNFNECRSAPCLNNGTCIDGISQYGCVCPNGFIGVNCEHNRNECASNPCLHGDCTDFVGGFECLCEPGWTSSRCAIDINECSSSPCFNEGICQDLVNGYRCVCPDGYSGSICQVDVNICHDSTMNYTHCLNSGTCVDGPGRNFSCRCPIGFSGKFCELDLDECVSGPCLNGGLCQDQVNDYSCTCTQGWTGKHCEVDINDCYPMPCVHGICVQNKPGQGYTCFCSPGYLGINCEQNYNDCFIYTCPAGFLCLDGLNNISCLPMISYTSASKGLAAASPSGSLDIAPTSAQPISATSWSLIAGTEVKESQGIQPVATADLTEEMWLSLAPTLVATTPSSPAYSLQPSSHTQPLTTSFISDTAIWLSIIPTSVPDDAVSLTIVSAVTVSSVAVSLATPVPCTDRLCLNGATCENTDDGGAKCYCGPRFRGERCEAVRHPSYAQYSGDSYLEFGGFHLLSQNKILVRFQTFSSCGMLLYTQQSEMAAGFLFIKLSVEQGFLQFQFACASLTEVNVVNTTVRVNDGKMYIVHIRQNLVPCEAEVTVVGRAIVRSKPSNDWSRLVNQQTDQLFLGGFPSSYKLHQIIEPSNNFTGCLEVMEINGLGPLATLNAVGRNNIDYCGFPEANATLPVTVTSPVTIPYNTISSAFPTLPSSRLPALPTQPTPPDLLHCQAAVCQNSGTCHDILLPSGTTSFQCDCALHFTGHFCEKDVTLFFPSFNGNAYLELPSLTDVLRRDAAFNAGSEAGNAVTLYLTIKASASTGTLLYSSEENFGGQFLHLFLADGRPTVKLGYGWPQKILTVSAKQRIRNHKLTSITVRYMLPVGSQGGYCMTEVSLDGDVPVEKKEFLPQRASQGSFGPIFLGGVPSGAEVHEGMGQQHSYIGCIRELQVNNEEVSIVEEAVKGRNIVNCDVPICDYQPCRNGGTCVIDSESWYCECPKTHSGDLCQFVACERSPCGHGATCVPKPSGDPVCLCPYGRAGVLCLDVLNVTQPYFSGTDEFGFSSFLAFSKLPNISLHFEFRLKFKLANHKTSMIDNLIFFTGQKGQGLNGDDFLVLGMRNGSVVYSFDLGSGPAAIVSDPLDQTRHLHVVHLGRSLRTGWLKVDDQKNKSATSSGHLVGLNVFSQFYVGGYSEYNPQLLPNGSHFTHGFQGCVYELQVRAGNSGGFRGLGNPEGHPNTGRSVGQCGGNPCLFLTCKNRGICVDKGSTVYCQCILGWKGAFCTETMMVCDSEHIPPHQCMPGSTCIPLPEGYACHCPLGTAGIYCEKALTISDPSFGSNLSSWMAFAPFNIRHQTHIRMQFRPRSPDGILFYAAQHLSPRSGDFVSISLVRGFVQLRYNLGDGTIILTTAEQLKTSGTSWHLVEAGRCGNRGYLSLDGVNVTSLPTTGMSVLDTRTDFYVGGVPLLSAVDAMAVEDEPSGFDGCVREVLVNEVELELTETGAKEGGNVGDCDGTDCGYKVCANQGNCSLGPMSNFDCSCPSLWAGPTCNTSVFCLGHLCERGSLCIPNPSSTSYSCACPLGRAGTYCENPITFHTARFVGNSYIRYTDPLYIRRDLRFTSVSFNFTTSQNQGLVLWMGKANDKDNDYLTVGISDGRLKIAVNLGERIAVPFVFRNLSLCCDQWHSVAIYQNMTVLTVYHDGERILFEDLDPQRRYVALNYGAVCYFGGFELHRQVNRVTAGHFTQGLVGKIKDIFLFQDSTKVRFFHNAEGFNVIGGDGN